VIENFGCVVPLTRRPLPLIHPYIRQDRITLLEIKICLEQKFFVENVM